MSSRPRRSALAPARFSPSLEESNPKPASRPSQQSSAPQKVDSTPPPSKKPVPSKKETPNEAEQNEIPSEQPEESESDVQAEQPQTESIPETQPEQPKENTTSTTATPKPVASVSVAKSSLFVSKAGRRSIPSTKLSPLSFANFGRKCLNLSATLQVKTDTKRRGLFQSPTTSEPAIKRSKKESQPGPSYLSIKAERETTSPLTREDIKPSTSGFVARQSPQPTTSSRLTERQEPLKIRIKTEDPTTLVTGSDVQMETETTETIFAPSPGPYDQATPPITVTSVRPGPFIRRPTIVLPLFEGRKSRNKSKPLSELAPDLLPNRHSIQQRQSQQRERQEALQRRKSVAEARRIERETVRIRKEQERVARIHRQEYIQNQQVQHVEPPQHLPASELPSPASLIQRSARKSLSIKIEDFDSESSIGRRSSKSISSPAVFGKRYAAYGTKAVDPLLGNSRFYSRMEQRKFQNPLACGLVPIRNDLSADDYFYREVLIKKPAKEDKKAEVDDQDVDVMSEDNTIGRFSDNDDEILTKNPAFDCVADIRGVLPAPQDPEIDEDGDEEMPIVDQIMEECSHTKGIMYGHLRIFTASTIQQRLIDLNTQNVVGGCSLFYAQSMKNATHLRDQLCLFSERRILAAEDMHAYLMRKLPDEYLAAYLNLLRFLKLSGSSLTMHLLDHPIDSEIQAANEHIREFVNTKIVDPNLRYGKCTDIVPLSNVSLVLVYPQVSMVSQTVVKHAHENMFRNLLPSAVRCVEKVELKFDEDVDPRTLTHMCLAVIRDRVSELVRRRPDDHVFLAGWGISSLLNMQAIQRVPGVTGVLNFAFPLRSYFGFRGSVDDTICVSYCPSLFVVGDSAANVSVRELQNMRENMICESGLVLVGGADSNLYVSPLVLSVERVSQHCVDRIILEHATDFMKQLINEGGMSAKERRQYLKPVKLPNSFDVDLNTLKGRASGFVPKLKQNKDAPPKKKEKLSDGRLSSNPPTPLSSGPSSSMLSSPAMSGPPTFYRPPLLSVASTSSIPLHRHPYDIYGHDLYDARALRRRTSLHTPIAVCLSEPRNPLSMPITTMSPMGIKREIIYTPVLAAPKLPTPTPAPKQATSAIEMQRMMSKEAEEATASITSFFNTENDDDD
ncbi:hypothetical protein M3Y97_01018600 [Aphelenchoides bicaudatus]|nr:hypothetical protein M3Y97_01018600 [Aphelenchoides bicaudatus]